MPSKIDYNVLHNGGVFYVTGIEAVVNEHGQTIIYDSDDECGKFIKGVFPAGATVMVADSKYAALNFEKGMSEDEKKLNEGLFEIVKQYFNEKYIGTM